MFSPKYANIKPEYRFKLKLHSYYLSLNPNAIHILEQNLDLVDYSGLSRNPNAIHMLEQTPNKVVYSRLCSNPNPIAIRMLEKKKNKNNMTNEDWGALSKNPGAIHLLEQNPHYVNWFYLSQNTNPAAVRILRTKMYQADWYNLSLNENPLAMDLVEQKIYERAHRVDWHALSRNPSAIMIIATNLDKVCWTNLCKNPNAIRIIERNMDRVSWPALSQNPSAIHILEQNLDRVDWHYLCYNSNAVHLLERNLDRVNWLYLSSNKCASPILRQNLDKNLNWQELVLHPNIVDIICDYDYAAMKKAIQPFAEELAQAAFHPMRITKLADTYGLSFEDVLNVY